METNLTFWKDNALAVIPKNQLTPLTLEELKLSPAFQSRKASLTTALSYLLVEENTASEWNVVFDQAGWFNALTQDEYPDTKFICVAWKEMDSRDKIRYPDEFYFCDDPETRESPWVETCYMTKWIVTFKKPFIIRELPEEALFELLVQDKTFTKFLEDHSYDAVLYMGDGSGKFGRVRQGLIRCSMVETLPTRILNYRMVINMDSQSLPLDFDVQKLGQIIATHFYGIEGNFHDSLISCVGETNAKNIQKYFNSLRKTFKYQFHGFDKTEIMESIKVTSKLDVNLLIISFVNERFFNLEDTKPIITHEDKHEPTQKTAIENYLKNIFLDYTAK